MSEDLKIVYTGSVIEAGYLVEVLEENKISSILRDSLSESLIAGWASGSPEDAARIYVESEHAEQAKIINRKIPGFALKTWTIVCIPILFAMMNLSAVAILMQTPLRIKAMFMKCCVLLTECLFFGRSSPKNVALISFGQY